jgi:hypothetical protein
LEDCQLDVDGRKRRLSNRPVGGQLKEKMQLSTIDDIDVVELIGSRIRYDDGQNNDWG